MSGSSVLQNMVRIFLLIFVAGLAVTILLTARQYAIDSSATQAAFVSLRLMNYFNDNYDVDPMQFDSVKLEQIMTKDAILGGDVIGIVVNITEMQNPQNSVVIRYGEEALKNLVQSAYTSNWKLHTIYRLLERNGKNYLVSIKVLGRVL